MAAEHWYPVCSPTRRQQLRHWYQHPLPGDKEEKQKNCALFSKGTFSNKFMLHINSLLAMKQEVSETRTGNYTRKQALSLARSSFALPLVARQNWRLLTACQY